MTEPCLSGSSHNDGFTLVEIAIVMVIIGLVIGSIFVGRDLIRAAENRSFMSQIEQLNAAVNTFKIKFACIPGDCLTATDFGFAANGNGNGSVTSYFNNLNSTYVDNGNSAPAQRPFFDISGASEGPKFYNHLRTANLATNFTLPPGGGTAELFPLMKNSNEWLMIGAWSGKHYWRTGMTTTQAGIGYQCRDSFSPADVLYLTSKLGQTIFTTTTTAGPGDPDAVARGEKVILVGADPTCPNDAAVNYPATTGAGGSSSNVCLNTSLTPPALNVTNSRKLCSLMIKTEF